LPLTSSLCTSHLTKVVATSLLPSPSSWLHGGSGHVGRHRCHRCVVVARWWSQQQQRVVVALAMHVSLSLLLLSLRGGGHVVVAFVMAAWWQWPCRCLCLCRRCVVVAMMSMCCRGTGHACLVVVTPWHSPSASRHCCCVVCGRVVRCHCELWRRGTGHPCHVVVMRR